MRRSLFVFVPLAAVLWGSAVPGPLAGQSDLMTRDPAGLTGLTSLIHVPVAGDIPVGVADITWDNMITRGLGEHIFYQRNVFVSLGLLPRLTVSARGTVARDSTRVARNFVGGGPDLKRDLSVSAQLLLLAEGRTTPAVSAGVVDPKTGSQAVNFTGYYVTASKTILGVSRLTAGYGWGPKAAADGMFGGLELRVGDWATAMGEYDGGGWNGGIRLFPLASVADRWGLQPRFEIVEREEEKRSYGIGVRLALGGPPAPARPAVSEASPVRPRTEPLEVPFATHRVLTDLVSMGFEDIRTAVEGVPGANTLVVEYENRRFTRSEWDALGVVMGVAARNAPEGTVRLRVVIRRVNLPVLSVTTDLDDFRAFVDGALGEERFAGQLVIEMPDPRGGSSDADRANPSALKLDVVLTPGLQTMLLTEFGVADARLWFVPDMYLRLGSGFVLNGRVAADVGESAGFFAPLFEDLSGRLLLHKGMRLHFGPGRHALTQWSAGMFRDDEFGVANQLDVTVDDGRVSVGSTLALFGSSLEELGSGVALGNVRVRHPEWDLTARLDAGIFRRGDGGAALELSRFFGATELGFFARFTNFGSVAGVRAAVPLSPSRELRPVYLRPRLPHAFSHSKQISILAEQGTSRPWVGRPLETDHEIERVYRDRDRLYAANLRAHVHRLRAAALRWVR